MKRFSTLSILFLFATLTIQAQMNNETMGKIIVEEAAEVEGRLGSWQFIYGQRLIYVITDENANRMRIFTPVVEEEKLEEGQLKKCLKQISILPLMQKYCLYEGLVITVYTHPLKELQTDQFIDAMRQVVTLADTFGGSYSSTGVIFNPGGNEETEEDTKEDRTNKKPQGKKDKKWKDLGFRI